MSDATAVLPDSSVREAVLQEALSGLTRHPRTLSPWLFYDERGSELFEQITRLPEYYLTRTERALFATHCAEILELASGGGRITLMELGAGSASKTGILLRCIAEAQGSVLYQPVDVSASALEGAAASLAALRGVEVEPQVANYITETFTVKRHANERVLALYIGSSIGNFSPAEATAILRNLNQHLQPGDSLLLGTDLAPGAHKSEAQLVSAYDDAAGVTAAFNLNVLERLNRELAAGFEVAGFLHRARWNAAESRMEMHLECRRAQRVEIDGTAISFAAGESIHTENSYKFNEERLEELLASSGFSTVKRWFDPDRLFAVTLSVIKE